MKAEDRARIRAIVERTLANENPLASETKKHTIILAAIFEVLMAIEDNQTRMMDLTCEVTA